MDKSEEYSLDEATENIRIIRSWLYDIRYLDGCPEWQSMINKLHSIEHTLVYHKALEICRGDE